MLPALPAELAEFQPARGGLLVLGGGVVAVFALSTLQRNNLAGHGTFPFVYSAGLAAKPCPRLARISATAVAAAENILRDTAKGKIADDLIAQGITAVKARIGIEFSSEALEARKPINGRPRP